MRFAALLIGLLWASSAAAHGNHAPLPTGASVEDRLERGDAYRLQDHPEAARAEYEAALRQAPRLVDALHRLARLEEETGRPAESLALWDRLLEQRPEDPIAAVARGRLLLATGRAAEAAAQLGAVLEAREHWPVGIVATRARALAAAGRPDEARAQLIAGIERLGAVPALTRALAALPEDGTP